MRTKEPDSIAKIVLDKLLAIVFLVIFSPVILVIGILIKMTSPGPVIFKQKRVGKNGVLFEMYKFRSMKARARSTEHRRFIKKHIKGTLTEKDAKGGIYKLEHDKRITPIGSFIRAHGLDEIPQFINVLKGDMSIVGPRPAIPYEIQWYEPWMKRRFMCTPGITGLWQTKGRNKLSFKKEIRYDIKYINHWSIGLDLLIMLDTIKVMFFKTER